MTDRFHEAAKLAAAQRKVFRAIHRAIESGSRLPEGIGFCSHCRCLTVAPTAVGDDYQLDDEAERAAEMKAAIVRFVRETGLVDEATIATFEANIDRLVAVGQTRNSAEIVCWSCLRRDFF